MAVSKIVAYIVLGLALVVNVINLAAKALMTKNVKDIDTQNNTTTYDLINGYADFGLAAAVLSLILIIYFLVTRLMDKICHDTLDVMLFQLLICLQFAIGTAFAI